ncbi:MAG: DUF1592 domain-containing protein [Myxococcota bacterium]|nr:DUF1592 domain-containing protein [Myxococcota bacterium]
MTTTTTATTITTTKHPRARAAALAPTLLLIALTGCTGMVVDGPDGPAGPRRPGPVEPVVPAACEGALDPGRTPFRRLTRDEYDRTVHDLLGDDTQPGRAFPPDEANGGFGAGTAVSLLQTEMYLDAAEILAAAAALDLGALLPCDPAAIGQSACAREFVETFGRRAYRRPLADGEVDSLVALYEETRAVEGFAPSIELVLTAMLVSPSFLYRVELGAPASGDAVVALTGYEIATRLSYLLWNSTPDDALLDAAARGELAAADGVEAQARRLLEDPRARGATRDFFSQYLGLEGIEEVGKDEVLHPEWNPRIARAMRREALAFVDHVLWEGDARFETLLTASFTFVDDPGLAALYGVEGFTGTEPVRVELDPEQRAGLLTMPALLATQSNPNQSSPVYRGKFVRETVLCQHLPSPPDGLAVAAPDPDPSLTTRERFAQHRSDASCSGCHQLMDPIGFGFERYDAIGMWRESEGALAVDDRGEIHGTTDADGEFTGAVELAARLASSEQARTCFATQWFRYGIGRSETEVDDCTLAEVVAAFEASDGDVLETIVSITRTDAFRHRRAIDSAIDSESDAEEVTP